MQHHQETVLYDGPAKITLGALITDSVALLLCGVGALTYLVHRLEAKRTRYLITDRSIQAERGLITRTVDVLDLYKIRDIKLEESLGWQTLTVYSADSSTPVLRMTFENARGVFEQLRGAIHEARSAAKVSVLETVNRL